MGSQLKGQDLLSIFRKEAETHIQELNRRLLELENDPQNKSALNEVRRHAHTLKGSARMMEFMEISSVAHTMEDLLENIMMEPSELDENVFDTLFQCLDSMSVLLQGGNGGKTTEEQGSPATGGFYAEGKSDTSEAEGPPGHTESLRPQREEPATQDAILVRTDKLDSLANAVGEMLLDQMKYEDQITKASRMVNLVREQANLWSEIKEKIPGVFDLAVPANGASQIEELDRYNELSASILDNMVNLVNGYKSTAPHRKLVMDCLQDDVRSIRLVPMSTIFDTFPRTIRDLSREHGKEIELGISGGEVELDKSIIDTIKDPLMHLVRNAIGHGIEEPEERLSQGKSRKGNISLSSYRQGSEVIIEISDDGAGIDLEEVKRIAFQKGLIEESQIETIDDESALQLIFTPGFSTSPIITDVSGRGVGMDVVMENVTKKLKGAVSVDTELRKGTKISIVVPVTLAIIRGLLVTVGGETFAIPTRSVEKNIKVPRQQIKSVEGKQVILDNKRIIPLVWLSDMLGFHRTPTDGDSEMTSVVIIDHAQKQVGFCVDSFGREQEMVVKSLGNYLKEVLNIAGVTILTNGEIVAILHVSDLMRSARGDISSASIVHESSISEKAIRKPSILIVDDSLTTRELEKNILEASGYDVHEAVDGLDGLNKVSEREFDLIIGDVDMPRVDGFEMVQKLKQDVRYNSIPVIMVTALQKDEEKRRGIEVGASAYIVKSSFDQGKLLETIRTLIG